MSLKKLAPWGIGVLLLLLVVPLATCKRDVALVTNETVQQFESHTTVDTTVDGTVETRRTVDLGTGEAARSVSMDAKGLKRIHIVDVEAEKDTAGSVLTPRTTVVVGFYDPLPAITAGLASVVPMSAAVKGEWECKWCAGILVCGVDPRCR